MSYTHDSKIWPKNGIENLIKPSSDCAIGVKAEPIILKKGEKLYVTYEGEEVKRTNDFFIAHMSFITKPMQVTINKPDDIEAFVGFAQREPAKKIGNDVYVIEATLLPYQFIHVRWWEKDKSLSLAQEGAGAN